jgi:hypothetical protein
MTASPLGQISGLNVAIATHTTSQLLHGIGAVAPSSPPAATVTSAKPAVAITSNDSTALADGDDAEWERGFEENCDKARRERSRGEHGPAMIAAFGMATEREPGQVAIADADLRGVHITRLRSDGCGKAGTDADKIMIGMSKGWPVVVAPPNDLLGLAITEGIEDALTVHEATGLGVWAAGSASRLPALADAVPNYIEAVTIAVDDDEAGRQNAEELRERLLAREVREVRFAVVNSRTAA